MRTQYLPDLNEIEQARGLHAGRMHQLFPKQRISSI
jgi:hypothetical protein